jgi:putative Mg2+ transporter-C (MgtC) family protein
LKRGELVTGVTTAATLWVVTVIGLCLGGGQIGLGTAATVLSVVTFWILKWFDRRIPREQRAMLVVEAGRDPASVADVVNLIAPLGYTARFQAQRPGDSDSRVALCFQISWRRAEAGGPPLDLLDILNGRFAVASFTLTSEAAINE